MFGNSRKWAIQGEGMYAGIPSVFMRTFGCNLRCSFGDHENKEVDFHRECARLGMYKDMLDLPVVKTGCDTYYSIYPEFAKLMKWLTVDQILELTSMMISEGKIKPHFVITGGEPLLPRWQMAYIELIEDLSYCLSLTHFTFETNGTQELIPEFRTFLRIKRDSLNISFSISPKLSNSGHKSNETLLPERVKWYTLLGQTSWFKYVVAKKSDIHEIEFFNRAYNLPDVPVYLMPQGGTRDEYLENESMVYDLCAEYGYRFSPRLQVTAANNGIGI